MNNLKINRLFLIWKNNHFVNKGGKTMQTRFHFIRHGQTQWNKQGIYQGWTDIPLSEEGKKQARCLRKRFENEKLKLDAVYSSPLQRAMQTAEAMAKAKGLTVIADDHFKEINFGEWEGHTVAQLSEKHGKAYTDFFENPFIHPFPGEGSFDAVIKRSVEGFELLLKKHEGANVAIVSHGGLLRVLIMTLMGMDYTFYRKTWLSNTSVTVIDVKENGIKLLLTLNDFSHLETL